MKITDTHIYFYGGTDGIYSNWYKAKFFDSIAKVNFSNTEQAFMWYKADFFKSDAVRTKIASTTDPKEVKALGREVKGFNNVAWECVRLGYMTWVNYQKFSQNQALKEELFNTDGKILVEASPYDEIWGVKLGENDPLILDRKNWKGLNLLGISLMQVRNMLIK